MKQLAITLAAIGSMTGCASNSVLTVKVTNAGNGAMMTSAVLTPESDSTVQGSMKPAQQGDSRVAITVDIPDLPASDMFGLHVYGRGDCSSADSSNAGSHFNPTDQQHGDSRQGMHHAGNIPMLQSDVNSKVVSSIVLPSVTLSLGPISLIGRALIVYTGKDDCTTQPTGSSGERIACDVVVVNRSPVHGTCSRTGTNRSTRTLAVRIFI